ncbi:MAG: alpha/beta fold hydrolase [Actinomycetota bacterium]
MATFALIHGAYHSGACFDLLARELAVRGHNAVAPDLPTPDPAAGAVEYSRVVEEAIGDAGDVIVVAHSMGGLTGAVLAARRPVLRIVYLGALVPLLGSTWDDYARTQPDVEVDAGAQVPALARPDGSVVVPFARAAQLFYHDCSWQTQQIAVAQLRPQHWRISHEVCPLDAPPGVPVSSIVCSGDRVINPEWSRRVAKERLGIDPIEMQGGHSPFYSRPAELAAVLDSLSAGA